MHNFTAYCFYLTTAFLLIITSNYKDEMSIWIAAIFALLAGSTLKSRENSLVGVVIDYIIEDLKHMILWCIFLFRNKINKTFRRK